MLFLVLEDDSDVDRKDAFAVSARDDRRSIRLPRDARLGVAPERPRRLFLLALQRVDAVVEDVRAPIDLVEKPRQILAAHFVGDVEEVLRLRVLERESREVGREDPLQRVPPEHALERVQPQRRLVVGDRARRARPVSPARRRLARRPSPRSDRSSRRSPSISRLRVKSRNTHGTKPPKYRLTM